MHDNNALKLDISTAVPPPASSHGVPITPDANYSASHSHLADNGDTADTNDLEDDDAKIDGQLLSTAKENATIDTSESHSSSNVPKENSPASSNNNEKKNNSPPHPPKPDEIGNRLRGPVPVSISKLGRVLSLDRKGYMHYEGIDDDGHSSSSQNSSDDGSYFSEQHLSPTSSAKRIDYPFVLPPKRSCIGMTNPRKNQPFNLQKSQSFGQHSYSSYGSKHRDSDLSLSSSSNDEDDYSTATDIKTLEKSFPMIRTSSAPERYKNLSDTLKPRADMDPDVDLGPVSSAPSLVYQKPPMPAREPLQVINSSDDALFKPRHLNRHPSASSLVSSSSDDVDVQSENASVVRVESVESENGSVSSRRSKHRRQQSYRSLDNSHDKKINFQVGNVLRSALADDVESELSDADSFVKHRRRRSPRHKRSESIASADSRIPLEIPSVDTRSSAGNAKVAYHSGLSDDQAKAWQNGLVRNDSYLSSSMSPERKKNNRSGQSPSSTPHKSISNHSLYSSGMLVYSEDDTDESAKLIRAASEQGRRERNELVAAGIGPSDFRGGRSYGKHFTNLSSKVELPGKGHSADQFSSGRSTDYHPSNYSTKGMAPPWSNDTYYSPTEKYKVYWQRWLMLMYMSVLNLLSDWTCYSVAPIAVLTAEAFGNINPEHLVTIFLGANALSTAMEPIILSRLGLRRTVVFGSFLLMCGSVIKSGGIPGIIGIELTEDDAQWKIYTGFVLVGLSQPLYQCTPTLLSCSWFPEKERTFATGVALNSNQLGIGFAFVFGTLLVLTSDDIQKYFGLLSTISVFAFLGCFLQFKDAPPTPPSETARVIRGTLEMKIPYMDTMRQAIPASMRPFSKSPSKGSHRPTLSGGSGESRNTGSSTNKSGVEHQNKSSRRKIRLSSRSRGSPSSAFKSQGTPSRVSRRNSRDGKQRRSTKPKSATADSGLRSSSTGHCTTSRQDSRKAPSPSSGLESTYSCRALIEALEEESQNYGAIPPSPMMNGRVGQNRRREGDHHYDITPRRESINHHLNPYDSHPPQDHQVGPEQYYGQPDYSRDMRFPPGTPFANLLQSTPQSHTGYPMHPQSSPFIPHGYPHAPQPFYNPNVDPRQMYPQHIPGMYPPDYYQLQQPYALPPHSMHYPPSAVQHHYPRSVASTYLPPSSIIDDGAEPIMSQTGDNLNIDIYDDQIIRSIRACFSRKGFTHTVVAFAASGIVLNTLSTYMDYLVRLGGSGRQTVGIIGGLFQLLVMVSSIVVGKFIDRSRAYYSVVIILLLLGAVALAECNINLDAERGDSLKWSLLLAACLIGPLQPLSTELAVDVSFPLCSNTVLVIQQLLSNLLSALFIPLFQALRDYGSEADGVERPQYTFSFYLLIVIHGIATVFFATFNGKYMRLAHEQRHTKDGRSSSIGKGRGDKFGGAYDEERAALLT